MRWLKKSMAEMKKNRKISTDEGTADVRKRMRAWGCRLRLQPFCARREGSSESTLRRKKEKQ